MSSTHKTVYSHLNSSSESENGDANNQTESEIESTQDQISEEPNTHPSKSTLQNPLQIPANSDSGKFTNQAQNPSPELPKKFSEVFSMEEPQVEDESLRLQHRRKIEAANQILRK